VSGQFSFVTVPASLFYTHLCRLTGLLPFMFYFQDRRDGAQVCLCVCVCFCAGLS
jgi:hypothetical protein